MAKRNYRKHREQLAKNFNTIGLKRKMLDKSDGEAVRDEEKRFFSG